MQRFYIDTSADVALVAATAKDVLYIKASANISIKVDEWWVEFDGTTSSAVPVLVELLRRTTDDTVTSETPRSAGSILEGDVPQFTGGRDASAVGTAGDILPCHKVSPTSGKHVFFPLGQEITVGKGERLAIRVTAAAGVNCRAGFGVKE